MAARRNNVANHASALKRARQDEKKRLQNRTQKSAMRTEIKKVLAAVEAGDTDTAATALNTATPMLDNNILNKYPSTPN